MYRVIEVFSWLLEVANDTKEHWDGARIVWSVSYVHDGPKSKDISSEIQPHEESRKKLIAKLEIQKDDIQSVLPISKVFISKILFSDDIRLKLFFSINFLFCDRIGN